jgi:uncharacterized glyoxalase superfamily protein PhnB
VERTDSQSARWRQTVDVIGKHDILEILCGQATRIEALAGAVYVGEMRHAPRAETLKYRPEGLSVRRHLILHAKPRLRCGCAGDNVVSLKLAQLLPKDFGRDAPHGSLKFAKSECPVIQTLKNHWLPAAFYSLNGRVQWTSVTLSVALRRLLHRFSNQTGYFKVPSCGDYETRLLLNMSTARLFRVIVPVSSIDEAAAYYAAVLDKPGRRISPGRHYFGCGQCILACFDPRADGDPWDAKPNPDHIYFAVDDLEGYFRRAKGQPKGSISRPIETQPWGEKSFYCSDPFGNKLCFVDEATTFTAEQM